MSIKVEHLFFEYNPKTPFKFEALKDVSLNMDGHFFSSIIGETGSGKSTFISHLNRLLYQKEGIIEIDDFLLDNKKSKYKTLKALRKHVGLVFQFPEYQLFAETVLDDVSFGPKNFGSSKEEALEKAKRALSLVNIPTSFYERSPFDLSGGEKRRVALASVIASEPDILILDEPTVGLDPDNTKMIMDLLFSLYEKGMSILLVSHDMNLVLKYTSYAYVFDNGKCIFEGKPIDVFSSLKINSSILMPEIFRFAILLKNKGFNIDIDKIDSTSSLVKQILKDIKK